MEHTAGAGGRPDRVRAATGAPASRRHRDRALPGDTRVDLWEGLALLLGLTVLSGSIVAMCIAGFMVLFGWLVSHPDTEPGGGGRAPFGPTGWM